MSISSRVLTSLSVSHLCKSFSQGSSTVKVLDDVSYIFDRKKSYALTGVSGTGKSTLLHLLAGLDTPDAGALVFNDRDISQFDPNERRIFLQKNLGLIFQSPCLLNELSVIENIMVKGIIQKQDYAEAFKKASRLLDKVGLRGMAQSNCALLSGGEQQRVAVARALFTDPAFILADEPTAHLDNEAKIRIMDLLVEFHQQMQAGLIIASHDVQVAQRMDIVLRLENGVLIEQ